MRKLLERRALLADHAGATPAHDAKEPSVGAAREDIATRLFISHSSDDEALVGALVSLLDGVLMEMGAAWGLQAWVVPLVAGGAVFGDVPPPIGPVAHAVKAGDAAGIEQLVDSVSARCAFAQRISGDRRRRRFESFISQVTD